MKNISRHLVIVVPLLLAACNGGEMRDTLGLNRDAPDEFTVLSRPPLSVPPEFSLRPPGEGSSPNEVTADEKARSLITGKEAKSAPDINTLQVPSTATAAVPVIANDTPTPAASTFLKRAGADAAKDDIRTQLGNDLRAPVDDSKAKTLYDKLTGGGAKADPVVDPKKEAERLRENKDAGKPVTEGDVPVQDEKSPSVRDKIF